MRALRNLFLTYGEYAPIMFPLSWSFAYVGTFIFGVTPHVFTVFAILQVLAIFICIAKYVLAYSLDSVTVVPESVERANFIVNKWMLYCVGYRAYKVLIHKTYYTMFSKRHHLFPDIKIVSLSPYEWIVLDEDEV